MSLESAVALHREGRLDEAANAYEELLAASPDDFEATHLLGVVALQQEKFDVAQQLIARALAFRPDDAVALGNLGTSFLRDGHAEAAFPWFERALALHPDSFAALANAGTALHHMGRYLEAIPLLRKAHQAEAGAYAVCNLLGACLMKCEEAQEASELFVAATRADPDNAEGWANLSVALNALGRPTEAGECADRAVALKPQSATALGALGTAQLEQGRLAEAVETYRRGVTLPGTTSLMILEFASALLASGLNDEAIEQLRRAVPLDERNVILRWALALAQIKPICTSEADVIESRRLFSLALDEVGDWYRTAADVHEPFNAVGISQPFHLAYHPFNNREILSRYGALCAAFMKTLPLDVSPAAARQSAAQPRKWRVGFVAAHVPDHSVWNAITSGWIYHLDRSKFELELFQLRAASDEETDRAKRAVDHFDNQPANLKSWVQAITARNLDALIYPEIGMDPLSVQLASLRLAVVQAASWGHPESTGLPTIDFYLSGEALEPPRAAGNYSENLVLLPNLGVYVETRKSAIAKARLGDLGLPRSEPLLLCPGSPFKYSPLDDDVWVQIAKRLKKRRFLRSGGGRLVFFRSRSQAMDRVLETRLRAAFERGGIDFDAHASIIPMLGRPRFFGLMRKSALMLDTLGFSGFNTAIQGIECDLPVLAYEGEFMRGRLASAIMRRIDLPELVAVTKDEFVEKAVDLAGNASARRALRRKITARRHVLFQDLQPIRALEEHLAKAIQEGQVVNNDAILPSAAGR